MNNLTSKVFSVPGALLGAGLEWQMMLDGVVLPTRWADRESAICELENLRSAQQMPDLQTCLDHGATICLYKGRTIDMAKLVRVYRNVAKQTYSILQDGIVVAHATRLALSHCTFIVNEKMRQRVLVTKRKNVHAYVQGMLTHSGMGTDPATHAASRKKLPVKVNYNPYKAGAFVSEGGSFLKGASVVMLEESGVYAAYTT